ncbi:MAG TPA: prenyltransferase/squalene oxidase repeat-containing protein [Ktedonobacterales bacterium]|nr:prenyltransferase/squalene oxidase repeat-containing protein [Ktedonobacterales bacterium]
MHSLVTHESAPSAEVSPAGALTRALTFLREDQRDGAHWAGVLSSSALATAMSIVALHATDAHGYSEQIALGRDWLLATQADDGGWGDAVVDSANINATSLALGALAYTQAGRPDAATVETRRRGETRLAGFGGWGAVGDPNRCTLSGPCRTVAALAGILDWRRIKRLRPEVIYLPAPIRRTISTTYPAYLSIAMLHAATAPHTLNRLPTYAGACRRAMEWLGRAQGPNGSFEESAFLTSVIITCMTASGHSDLPWLPAAIRFVAASQREDGGWPIDRDLETFDTDMSVFAFAAAGEPTPGAESVRSWLLARQFTARCFPTGARPGGWAWAMPAGWPDSDDTAYTLLALRALGVPAESGALRRGARWLEGMQCSNGGWSTFVRNSSMPFDHDCPYVTGHALSALHAVGRLGERPRTLERALGYLRRAQRYDGSFASIWFREATAGTASVLEALADCDLLDLPMATRASDYLLRSQNDDGGWAGLRMTASTAEETSWAVMALLRWPSNDAVANAIRRGVGWLAKEQRPDGTWTPAPIGLYYSAMWYSDSYYAVTLPAQALARARAAYDWA